MFVPKFVAMHLIVFWVKCQPHMLEEKAFRYESSSVNFKYMCKILLIPVVVPSYFSEGMQI